MIKIERFVCNMLQENCYVVSDESKECAIIDCGAFYEQEQTAIQRYILDEQLTPKHLLVTHAHLDHNFGNYFLHQTFGLLPQIAAEDQNLYKNIPRQAEALYGIQLNYEQPPVGHLLKDKETIAVGNQALKVIHTPGHSPGGVCFYHEAEGVLFTGDTLFERSIGRTDLHGSIPEKMNDSLKKLYDLEGDYKVLPGHNETTTLEYERNSNPFMRQFRG